jgi:hypothetical protein
MIVKQLPALFFQFRADVEFLCPSAHPSVDSPDIVTGHILAIPYDLDSLHHKRESIQLIEELGIDHRDILCDLGCINMIVALAC